MENPLKFVEKYLQNLKGWTDRKAARAGLPGYLAEKYDWQLAELQDILADFPNIRTEFEKPMRVLVQYMDDSSLEQFGRWQLLMGCLASDVDLVSVDNFEMKLDLPPGLQTNSGVLYYMDEKQQEDHDRYNTLYVRANLRIGARNTTWSLPFDFCLAHANFRQVCSESYEQHVVQKNITDTMEACKKHSSFFKL